MRVIKRFGYFWQDDGGTDANGRSLYERVRRNPPDNCERIVRYQNTAQVLRPLLVRSVDVLSDQEKLICAPDTLTDGEWMWTRDLAYYVEHYHVELPPEFLAIMERHDFEPPALGLDELFEVKSALVVDWVRGGGRDIPYRDLYGARRRFRLGDAPPPQPKPNRMLKDAGVFFVASVGFLIAGIIAEIVHGFMKYTGPGFSPAEVMGYFMFTAAAVLFATAFLKLALAGWDV